MTDIYLIRHAEAMKDVNTKDEDLFLSDDGNMQARFLGTLEEFQNLDLVMSSNYLRTICTARYLVSDTTKFVIDERLKARVLGRDTMSKEFWLWQFLDEYIKYEGGESRREVEDRMQSVVEDVLKDYQDGRIALVSHGLAISFLLLHYCTLEDIHLEGKMRKISFNGEIVMDDRLRTPDVFKLTFNEEQIDSIKRIRVR